MPGDSSILGIPHVQTSNVSKSRSIFAEWETTRNADLKKEFVPEKTNSHLKDKSEHWLDKLHDNMLQTRRIGKEERLIMLGKNKHLRKRRSRDSSSSEFAHSTFCSEDGFNRTEYIYSEVSEAQHRRRSIGNRNVEQHQIAWKVNSNPKAGYNVQVHHTRNQMHFLVLAVPPAKIKEDIAS